MNTNEEAVYEELTAGRNWMIDKIFTHLGCSEDKTKNIINIMLADIQLFDKKQRDYGELNISKFGEFGILVRVNDKIERLTNLRKYDKLPNNEAINDSWQDLSIYATIARAINEGSW
jgi:nucleoid DNA-binding protein